MYPGEPLTLGPHPGPCCPQGEQSLLPEPGLKVLCDRQGSFL